MLKGLELMTSEELVEIGRLIGVEGSMTPRELRAKVKNWTRQAVGCEETNAPAVERAVLEWTARRWNVAVEPHLNTDDLERALRITIASEAAGFLEPGWQVVCALIACGPAGTSDVKLDMLQNAATLAVPSRTALKERRQSWNELCRRWNGRDPRQDLEPALATLRGRQDSGRGFLSLGVVLSLVDGRVTVEVERLFRDCCDALGLERQEANEVLQQANELFWHHHNRVSPTSASDLTQTSLAESAARRSIEASEALEALALEARANLLAVGAPARRTARGGWSRLVGGFSGLSGFFASRQDQGDPAELARIVYHTILKQHQDVVDSQEEAPPAPVVVAPAPVPEELEEEELPTPAPAAPELAPAPSRRVIRLNPTSEGP